MILHKDKIKEFEEICKPVIKWLNDNCHPHVSVVIDPTSAELLEGVASINTMEFLKD